MTQPIPPTNVRIETDQGPIPLELIYTGRDRDGRHLWEAPVPLYVRGKNAKIRYDDMPPDTGIAVRFGMEGFEPL